MKILWVKSDFLHPTTKGGHIRTLEILKRLHARHEIHYAAFVEPGDAEGPRRSTEYCARAYPVPHSVPRKDSPAFLRQIAAGLIGPLPVTIRRCRSAAMRRRILGLLAEQPFDRLVCDFLAPAPNIPRLREWVLFQHNVESAIWWRRAEHAGDPVRRAYLRLQASRMREYEGHVCREAGEIVAVSRQDAGTMRRWFGVSRVAVVPTGVDVEYFSGPTPVPRVADLVFVGSMDWLPNVDGVAWFAREMLPRIRSRRPDCTVAIVGRSPDRTVAGLASSDPRILVTGTVDDVRPYLWGSTVAIVPLRIGGGTRLKIYEAMAAGVPVVSTTVGAEGLEVSSPRNIRLADTPDAFASACAELLHDEEARARQAREAREMVHALCSWEAAASAFEEILERRPGQGDEAWDRAAAEPLRGPASVAARPVLAPEGAWPERSRE